MIRIRRSAERGHFRHGWLDTFHTFSFAEYVDPDHMGFRTLRVINEDRVAPGRGFPKHSHRDMEILTWVLSGTLEHRDGLGNGAVVRPGDLQRMSAGTGVSHSEVNPSPSEPVHLLQVWILPERKGRHPGYEQVHFPELDRRDRLCLVASPQGREGSVGVGQDADVYAGSLSAGTETVHRPAAGRHVWVQVARGTLRVHGEVLEAGDGMALDGEEEVRLKAETASELLLFDLA